MLNRLAHIQFKFKATQKRLGQTLMRNLNKNNLYFLHIEKLVKMQHSTAQRCVFLVSSPVDLQLWHNKSTGKETSKTHLCALCRPLDRGEGGLNVVRF